MKYYLAIDIGASSGRHIVGWKEDGEIKTKEVYRFPNGVEILDGHLTWNIDALLTNVKSGIDAALSEFPKIESLSIDTWGVDYVLLRGDEEILPCYADRDGRAEAVIPEVHEKVPFSELYRRTGIQFQPFNTVYQLYADKLAGRLDGVTDFLMMPEYLMYKLTGVKAHEYTNATTGGMVSAETGEYDPVIIDTLGLPKQLFHPVQQPGTVIGEYEGMDKCIPLMDNGHYHPTEVVSDKIPALLAFFPEIALHVTRPIRWDSDHVVLFDDETREIAREIVRCGGLEGRVDIALDYFDASINRVSAWVTGYRNTQKALLFALLQPNESLKAMQDSGDFTKLMVTQEELKTLPFGEVWDEYCRGCGKPADGAWFDEVERYEKEVLEARK